MDVPIDRRRLVAGTVALMGGMAAAGMAQAASRQEIDAEVDLALDTLFRHNSAAKALSEKAKAILVFPRVVKGGFVVGGSFGEGALLENRENRGYYNTVSASFGLQAGAESFAYALFFMNEKALSYLTDSRGFELGVGPTLVVVDEAVQKQLTTTNVFQDVYAFIFSEQGLMAGLGIEGSKISRIEPEA
ncbi:MAG TPA: YSC84-related protein [Geminicoccus sp.]|jgi:lipid-binding SYLF domain-containing protein|uniref:lipid-binding SYLF domain-containing protein n=1 Tax=Geminicoccus sp. TaxID=2024832 RepID=UPI002E34F1C6|nr:YSC84-related protein [Geminicoccus sp.]HEX2525885.1 YSC84-related protein [Geminicoccus sp.]